MYPTITVADYGYIFDHADVKIIFAGDQTIYDKAVQVAGKQGWIRDEDDSGYDGSRQDQALRPQTEIPEISELCAPLGMIESI